MRKGALAIVDYEYARRRYEWSKRLNWFAVGACAGLGTLALLYGVLAYSDWQWLHDHFSGAGADSTRWTPDKISAKFTTAILLMIVGALGYVTLFIGLFFVRRFLDEDKVDAVRKWSLIAGVTGVLPGAVFGGLLEFFVWRAHAAESFTIFGLLGKAPEPAPGAGAVALIPAYNPHAEEERRKSEYDALFATPAPAAPPSPDYGYGYAPAPAQAPAYAYGQQAPAYDYSQQPAPAQPEDAYAQAAVAAAAPPPAETGTQYQQPSGAPICTCGRPMEWVPEYNRYYCYADDKYEGES